ncbi:MAG: hypothetical protein PHU91_04760 [Candidatus Omnitrophica bacterium]|nr:hypothetical protein [Candidatus Omnitrophota bacterium]MDD5611332.1 hypothetical protein [Candidatus Omnitrophota bacterium]
MFKKTSLFFIIFLGLTLIIPFFSFAQTQSEQITLTTYYPSPYGVYKTLRLYPQSTAVEEGNCSNEGDIAYSQGDHMPLYCNANLKWKTMKGGAAQTKVFQGPLEARCTLNYPNLTGCGFDTTYVLVQRVIPNIPTDGSPGWCHVESPGYSPIVYAICAK